MLAVTCRAKVALQKLNTDVVHGVSSGNLDVDAIALDNRDVQSALGGALSAGRHRYYPGYSSYITRGVLGFCRCCRSETS